MSSLEKIESLLLSQNDLIRASLSQNAADIRRNSDMRPRLQLRVQLDLTSASLATRPLELLQPFDGFYVESASDATTSINMSFTSREQQNITQYTAIKSNDSATFNAPLSGCLLTWAAQSGKTMTLILYLGIQFRPGSQVSNVSGGVNLTTGTGMTPVAAVSVATTATLIAAADTTRKKTTIQNRGGSTVYISGTSGVVATAAAADLAGIELLPGAIYEWINTGAIYGIASGAASVVSINTEA